MYFIRSESVLWPDKNSNNPNSCADIARSSHPIVRNCFSYLTIYFSKHKKVSENNDNFKDDLPRTEASEEDEHGEKK